MQKVLKNRKVIAVNALPGDMAAFRKLAQTTGLGMAGLFRFAIRGNIQPALTQAGGKTVGVTLSLDQADENSIQRMAQAMNVTAPVIRRGILETLVHSKVPLPQQ